MKYSACVGFHNSSSRKSTFQLGVRLFEYIKSKNVFVSSGCSSLASLRSPHDVANLSSFFSLSPALSKSSIMYSAHKVVYCASQRRQGATRCVARVQILPQQEGEFEIINSKRKLLDETNDLDVEENAVSDNKCQKLAFFT